MKKKITGGEEKSVEKTKKEPRPTKGEGGGGLRGKVQSPGKSGNQPNGVQGGYGLVFGCAWEDEPVGTRTRTKKFGEKHKEKNAPSGQKKNR